MLKLLLFLVFILSASLAQAGGVLVGNGGNIIRCSGKIDYQSTDYVMLKIFIKSSLKSSKQKVLRNHLIA